jgi:DNA-binding transcriptional regulator YiaG
MTEKEIGKGEKTLCPDCASDNLDVITKAQDFEYGLSKDRSVLTAIVPVLRCQQCDFEFTDYRAEIARHDAVCRHLGILTPGEITGIREEMELSRVEFAELGGFGIASLQRWETGALVQNAANDRLIYLLQFTANRQRLLRKVQDSQRQIPPHIISSVPEKSTEQSGHKYVSVSLSSLANDEALARSASVFSELMEEGAIFQL